MFREEVQEEALGKEAHRQLVEARSSYQAQRPLLDAGQHMHDVPISSHLISPHLTSPHLISNLLLTPLSRPPDLRHIYSIPPRKKYLKSFLFPWRVVCMAATKLTLSTLVPQSSSK